MTKAKKMLTALVNNQLTGIEIDEEKGIVRFDFTNGFIEVEGEDFGLYVELDEAN
jgi:hypothetical protein